MGWPYPGSFVMLCGYCLVVTHNILRGLSVWADSAQKASIASNGEGDGNGTDRAPCHDGMDSYRAAWGSRMGARYCHWLLAERVSLAQGCMCSQLIRGWHVC